MNFSAARPLKGSFFPGKKESSVETAVFAKASGPGEEDEPGIHAQRGEVFSFIQVCAFFL
jgi:hypothetical protein